MKHVFTFLCMMTCALFSMAQTTVAIGTGTGTSANMPITGYYGYSYSQAIYTADEIWAGGGDVGVINKIRYYYNSGTYQNALNWDVYIGHTTKNAFTGNTDWIAANTLSKAFSGTVTMPAAGNWVEITLTTPFNWNGVDNIVIAVDENQSGYSSTTLYWGSSSKSVNRGIVYYNDPNNINPLSPPTASSTTSNVANVQFDMQITPCAGKPVLSNPVASVTSVCKGNDVSFRTQVTTGGMHYVWQYNDGASWNDIPNSDRPFITMNSPAKNISVRVIGTCANGNQSDTSGNTLVTIYQPPVVQVLKSNYAVCPGDSVVLSASGANNYTWSPATSLNLTNAQTVVSFPANDISYTVRGTDTNGCEAFATANITMIKNVRAKLAHTPANICSPQVPLELWIKDLPETLSEGGKYEYQFLHDSAVIARDWDTLSRYEVIPPADGKYTFYYKVRSTGCPDEVPDSGKTSFYVGFWANVAKEDFNCIRPGSLSLLNVFGQAAYVDVYSNPFSVSTDTSKTQFSGSAAIRNGRAEITPSATSVTGYLLIETDSTTKLGFNHAMDVSFLLTADNPINVFGTGGADGLAYSFGPDALPASPGAPFNGKGTGLRLSFDAADNGTSNGNTKGVYLVYGWNSSTSYGPASAGVLAYSSNTSLWKLGTDVPVNLSVSSEGKATVTVNGTVLFDEVQLPDTFMKSDVSKWKHLFSAGTGGDALRHAIKDLKITRPHFVFGITPGNTNIAPTVWQDEPVFDSLAAGTYAVWIANPNTPSCAKHLGVSVIENLNPQVNLGNDTLVCRSTTLALDAGNPGLLYTWNNGNDSQIITAVQPGIYGVTVTDSLGCQGTDSILIEHVGVPCADSIQATITFAQGAFSIVAANNTELYNWDFGDGQTQSNGGSTVVHTYTAVGKYAVTASLINRFGCDTFVLAKEIEIKMLNTGMKENTFTDLSVYPNPVKDAVKIALSDYTKAEVIVHNMYGAEVYKAALTSNEINVQDWAEGVYFLTITRGEQTGMVKVVVQK